MRIPRPTQASVRWIIIGLAAAGFLAGVYLQVTTVNTTLRRWDQGAYFDFIKEVRESDFRFTGQRNRMPLYPYLQAPFFSPYASEEESFSRAKTVNVSLSLTVLAILAFAFYKRLRRPSADLLLAILAFTVFAWRAAYLQCELVYYALAFWSWVAMSNQIERPSWWRASSIAAASALTHFTKPSILPGLAVFLIVFVSAGLSSRREFSRRALQSVWIIALFLGLLSPYLMESKEKYGRYFYNVNSTFYFWYDSWDECSKGTKAHGDRMGWPDMPDEDIPSLGRYLERHDVGDIARRMLSGLVKNLGCFVERKGNNYGRFVFLSLLFAGLLMWRGEGKVPVRRRSLRVFQIGWILTYLLLFAWYAPIAHGNRFIQSLLLPILYPLFRFFDSCEETFTGHKDWRASLVRPRGQTRSGDRSPSLHPLRVCVHNSQPFRLRVTGTRRIGMDTRVDLLGHAAFGSPPNSVLQPGGDADHVLCYHCSGQFHLAGKLHSAQPSRRSVQVKGCARAPATWRSPWLAASSPSGGQR